MKGTFLFSAYDILPEIKRRKRKDFGKYGDKKKAFLRELKTVYTELINEEIYDERRMAGAAVDLKRRGNSESAGGNSNFF